MDATTYLPSLDAPYPLSPSQIEEYRRNGHIKLAGLASTQEMEAYGPAIRHAAERLNTESRKLADRDTYGKAFLQTMNLWRSSPEVAAFTLAKRFGRVAAQLMGVERVRLYHDQALFKEPGGGATPWHQDQHYWPLDTDWTITLWAPLVDVSREMGTMHFASGSHREGYLGDLPISDKSEELFAKFLADKGYPIAESGEMAAGDATFHSGWTLHGAPGNSSERMREVMTIIYFADGTRVGHADNANRQNDLKTWLPGLSPGDLAASEINPVIG